VKKGDDGKYHIHNTNSNESIYGARDTDEDVAAMYGVMATSLRAASILKADAELQSKWKEFLANLTPLATSDDADALKPDGYSGPRVFVRVAGLEMHPLDGVSRTKLLKEELGLGYCNITKCCTEVCPEDIHITDNAIIPLKERVVDDFYDPIAKLLRRVFGPR